MGGHKDKKKDKKKEHHRDHGAAGSDDDGSDERRGETEEERRKRRAEKKVKKAAKEAEKARQFMGYTNDTNPWNDGRLTEKFVWGKREQRVATLPQPAGGGGGGGGGADGAGAAPARHVSDKERRAELQAELARVKKAREAREAERDEWEREKERIEREREQFAYAEHQKRADEFHLEQASTRAAIRLQEGRAKPIDVLSFHLLLAEKEGKALAARKAEGEPVGAEAAAERAAADAAAEAADAEQAELLLSQMSADVVKDPVNLFRGLMAHELRTLLAELDERVGIDDHNREFWHAMHTVCEAEAAYQRKREKERRARWGNDDGGEGAAEARREAASAPIATGFVTSGLHESVASDVARMLGTKSTRELDAMRVKIERTIRTAGKRQQRVQRLPGPELPRPAGGSSASSWSSSVSSRGSGSDDDDDDGDGGGRAELDVDYWQGVLALLKVARAKARLREVQRALIARQQERMRGKGGGAAAALARALAEGGVTDGAEGELDAAADAEVAAVLGADAADVDEEDEPAADDDEAAPFDDGRAAAGCYSPPLAAEAELPEKDRRVLLDPDEEVEALEAERRRVAAAYRRAKPSEPPEPADSAAQAAAGRGGGDGAGSSRDAAAAGTEGVADPQSEALVESERRKGLEQGEAQFSYEFKLEQHEAWWHEKYKPRKPRYFNRVHTGYEWNKYNQTHYDHDNPPPKSVQGYKFNIFYPDLIERSSVPAYQLLPDPSGATDTCLIKFHAGPPYEDVAFKIVNMEWELSHRRGFKCRFERGVLQLYFNFKRHRYRR